ncbi:MAG: SH3 domain-containing protein [Planctomycetes bacterium]|nr:SH3 domain-containing protein [Planctomycetota bacterium]
MRAWLVALFVCLSALAAGAAPRAAGEALDARAVEAYRAGDLATARTLWLELLEDRASGPRGAERARVLYDLGTLALREDQPGEAAGWFTASLRLRPRDRETWENLEYARLEAGLPAADRGDLADTAKRLVSSWTPGEARTLALLSLLPLALCLLLEALRGGWLWRVLGLGALCVACIGALPMGWSMLVAQTDPVLVIDSNGAQVRVEPRGDASAQRTLAAGDVVERLAEHPDWVQVRVGADRGWVRESSVFALDR